MELEAFLDMTFLANPLSKWLWAAAVFLGTLLVIWVVVRLVGRWLRNFAAKTQTIWDDLAVSILDKTKPLLLVFVALAAAIQVLDLPAWFTNAVQIVAVFALMLQIGIWAVAALTGWADNERREKQGEGDEITWLSGIEFAGKLVIWSVVLLVGLENVGIDVTGLAAGLGIGGIAVALAVQNILGDLFSSFSIYLDKPFVIGDFLSVDSLSGNVENIGLKTTRVRSLSGEQLIFSNSDLLKSRIRNYGRMQERRAVFKIGVTYDTPAEKVEEIPKLIRSTIEQQANARFDRSHFKEFGDFSLDFETVFYMLVPDYQSYMDTQEKVNLEILRRFGAEGIEFAFPTQTLYIEGDNGGSDSITRGAEDT